MRRLIYVGLSFVFVLGLGAALHAGGHECCDSAKAVDGWCKGCSVGFVKGHQISSAKLHKALAGTKVSADAIECGGCKKAAKDNGNCEGCHVYFAKGKAYHSPVAYILAVGYAVPEGKMECEGCIKAAKSNGTCEGCHVGFVGNLAYKDEAQHEKAIAAMKVLEKAIEAAEECEDCAVGLVMNGKCESCNVSFKNGKMMKS